MRRAPKVNEAPPIVADTSKGPRTSASPPVIALRFTVVFALLAATLFYFVVDSGAEAPDTFSLGDWTLMLLPPSTLIVSLALGSWFRTFRPSRTLLYLSRSSAVVASMGLVVACSLSLLWFLGALFDYAIS